MKPPRDTLHDLPNGDAEVLLAHLIEIRNVAAGVVQDLDDLIELGRRQAAAVDNEPTDRAPKRPPGRGRTARRA
jgi:hypothetical protein